MKTHKFFSSLKDNFARVYFTQELLDDITGHYGVGYKDKRGLRENVGWKDFVEVRTARRRDAIRPHARARGSIWPGAHPRARARWAGRT